VQDLFVSSQLDGRYELRVAADRRAFVFARWHQRVLGRDELRVVAVVAEAAADVVVEAADQVLQRTAASSPSPPGDRGQLTGSSREPRPQDSSPKPSLQPATSHRIFFTEFTEATNVAQHTDDISRHRLPPYSSTIYMTNTSFKSSSLPLV